MSIISRLSKIIITIFALFTIIIFLLNLRLSAKEYQFDLLSLRDDIYYLPPKKWLRPLSLGYNEALRSLLWVKSLIYFGEQVEIGGSHRWLKNYIEAMIELDPYFNKIYHWAGLVTIYHVGLITHEDVKLSIYFLKKGLRYFPNDGDLEYTLGCNYLFELPRFLRTERERERAKTMGAEHMRRAAIFGGGPSWLKSVAASFLERYISTELAIAYLEEALFLTKEEGVRKQLLLKLSRLKSERAAKDLALYIQKVRQRWQKEFPYISLDLYLLIGPKILGKKSLMP
jgi:tetratricopeptide (TPR) repeat protein